MRTTRLVSLVATVILLADVVSTATDFNRAQSPQIASDDGLVVRSLSSDTNHGLPKRMLRTNSDNANNSEERMINSVLGKVGSVVEAGGAKVAKEAPKLEKYQQWLTAKLTPSQVRVGELKNEPWQKLHSILQGKDSDQYLKFIVDHKRLQPGSTIPKPASNMENFELWLYAGLTPSQVRVDILKTEPQKIQTILHGKDSIQYLKFLIDYKRMQPGNTIPKSASSMKKSELWLYAGLTPSQVRTDVFKNVPLEKILKSKDSYQYLKFVVDYKRLQPGNTILTSASNMELSELWLLAGLTPAQVRIDILKNVPLHRTILQTEDTYQYLKFLVDYKRLQPGSTIPKSASKMEDFELWLFAGLKPSQVHKDILKNVPFRTILQSQESHQYLKFWIDYRRLRPGNTIPKPASSMDKSELWLYSGLKPSEVHMDILKTESQNIRTILQGQDSYEYLRFLAGYERLHPRDTKSMPTMEKFEMWLLGGLTPTQVHWGILKNEPLKTILKSKDSYQYLKFIVDYKRQQPGSTIPKPASSMKKFELWLYAGLKPAQVRAGFPGEVTRNPQFATFVREYKRLNPSIPRPGQARVAARPLKRERTEEVWRGERVRNIYVDDP